MNKKFKPLKAKQFEPPHLRYTYGRSLGIQKGIPTQWYDYIPPNPIVLRLFNFRLLERITIPFPSQITHEQEI